MLHQSRQRLLSQTFQNIKTNFSLMQELYIGDENLQNRNITCKAEHCITVILWKGTLSSARFHMFHI